MISLHSRKYHLTDLPFLQVIGEKAIKVHVLIKPSISQGMAGIRRLSRPAGSSFTGRPCAEDWELRGGHPLPPAASAPRPPKPNSGRPLGRLWEVQGELEPEILCPLTRFLAAGERPLCSAQMRETRRQGRGCLGLPGFLSGRLHRGKLRPSRGRRSPV